jgi:hypothetical protein
MSPTVVAANADYDSNGGRYLDTVTTPLAAHRLDPARTMRGRSPQLPVLAFGALDGVALRTTLRLTFLAASGRFFWPARWHPFTRTGGLWTGKRQIGGHHSIQQDLNMMKPLTQMRYVVKPAERRSFASKIHILYGNNRLKRLNLKTIFSFDINGILTLRYSMWVNPWLEGSRSVTRLFSVRSS